MAKINLSKFMSNENIRKRQFMHGFPYLSGEEQRLRIKEYYEGLNEEQIKSKNNFFDDHEIEYLCEYMTEKERKKYYLII